MFVISHVAHKQARITSFAFILDRYLLRGRRIISVYVYLCMCTSTFQFTMVGLKVVLILPWGESDILCFISESCPRLALCSLILSLHAGEPQLVGLPAHSPLHHKGEALTLASVLTGEPGCSLGWHFQFTVFSA